MLGRILIDWEKSRILLRVGLMCALIIPSWMIGRGMAPLFFYSFGPIVAGFYAGMTCYTRIYVFYACLATSILVTLILVGSFAEGSLLEIAWIMTQLFGILMGLLILGVITALIIRRHH